MSKVFLMILAVTALVLPATAVAHDAHGSGRAWSAVSWNLAPHKHVRLACPKNLPGVALDVAARDPFQLTNSGWGDGGELYRWTVGRDIVATARPSQTYGLDRVDFRSYRRPVAVEIICEGGAA